MNIVTPKPLDTCYLRAGSILIDCGNKLANFPSSEARSSWEDEVIHCSILDGDGRPLGRKSKSDGGVEVFLFDDGSLRERKNLAPGLEQTWPYETGQMG